MYKIVKKEVLAPNIFSMDILAPRVASSAKPGQFVIVIADETGERVPLTICDYDAEKGTVQIVVQSMGSSTKKMAVYEKGEYFKDFVGPLGVPSDFVNEDLEELRKKKILFVAGGVGTAPVYPQVKWLHDHGVEADVIMGSKNKDLVILEDKLKSVAGNLYVATDDGSYGFHGLVTNYIEELVNNQGKQYDLCIAIGTGMCGACRVTVGGETKFACVDGPEFDGHLVNFDEALKRQGQYKTEEIKKDEANTCKVEEAKK